MAADTRIERDAIVGDRVRTFDRKIEWADVKFEGTIVAIFTKKSGLHPGRIRYVVENDDGVEMTFGIGALWIVNNVLGEKGSGKMRGECDNDYDPAFVESILQADAAPVEATFDNVTDMLDWLERDV
jgi:hypothetical protein